ncbi:MFS transporter [Agromyces sp. MMS24-JH15]|uniref:MFS transporter n=1 Tax=Agromyces sp. MMS24-JH15 TaxID=3243765 RepID=UPI00374A6DBB
MTRGAARDADRDPDRAPDRVADAATDAASDADRAAARLDGRLLAIGVGTAVTTLLDQAVFSFAVPGLRDDLGADPAQVQWLVAGYSLAFGLALVPGGRIGDLFGRRAPYLAGLALFGIGGVFAATGGDPLLVIVARIAQGLGAGLVNPQVLGWFQDRFTGAARAKALGAYTTAGSIAGLAGPLLGGWVLASSPPDVGWRLVLLLPVPFAICLLAVAWAILPGRVRAPGAGRRPGVDAPGLALLVAATLCLMLPTTGGTPGGAWWLVGAAVAAGGFLLWERRAGRTGGAVLDRSLARSRGFLLGTAVATLLFGSGLGLGIVTTLFLIDGLGFDPFTAALLLGPRAVGTAIGSAQSWRVATRAGRRGTTLVLAAGAVAIAVEAALVATASIPLVLVALVGVGTVHGVLSGLAIPANQTLTLEHAPPDRAGVGAAFMQLSQRLAAAVCLAAGTGLILSADAPADSFVRAAVAFGAVAAAAAAVSLFDRTALVRAASTSSMVPSMTPRDARSTCAVTTSAGGLRRASMPSMTDTLIDLDRSAIDRAAFARDWEEWHRAHEAARANGHGFLAITGLHWLGESPQRIEGVPGAWSTGEAGPVVELDEGDVLELDGEALAGRHAFGPIAERDGLTLRSGRLAIELAKRGGHDIVRPRDPEFPYLARYTGTPTYLPNPRWLAAGRFLPFDAPRDVTVGAAVEGLQHVYEAPGEVEFVLRGETFRLTAFNGRAPGSLFVLFTDATSGLTTYAANRSLAIDAPDAEGRVVLDFNRAVNLPCAYTDFATCPLPPAENRLPVGIEAGEKTPLERQAA